MLQHAVIHRDIKPDNLVIRNIRLDDDAILVGGGLEHLKWSTLRERWHLTLVDFGFARALSPQDLESEEVLLNAILMGASHSGNMKSNKNNLVMHFDHHDSTDEAIIDTSSHFSPKELLNHDSSKSRTRKGHGMNDDTSKSRHIVRRLSAIGNRTYTAPEVKFKVRQITTTTMMDASRHQQVNSTLIPFVSDYGMVADAFSVGATARYVFTGVPAQENFHEFMAHYNSPLSKVGRWIGRKLAKRRHDVKPKKKYRPSEDVPVEAVRLIKGMTQANAGTRMTVRDARMLPYIDEVVGENTATFKKEMTFLKCSQN